MTLAVERIATATPDRDHSHAASFRSNEKTAADTRLRGVIWLTAQAFIAKVLQLVTLIPLTWLITADQFGLIGLVTAVISLTGLIQQTGIREILIQRQQEFDSWSNAAFWMSSTLGIAGGLLIAAFSPFAAIIWNNERLTGLLLILALTVPLQALMIVPEARLYTRLRFRSIAWIGIVLAVVQTVLSVGMAWLGAGAYSVVVPQLIITVLKALALWAAVRPPFRLTPEFARWRLMVTDSSVVFITNLSYIIVSQGDYLVLGMMVDATELGHYFLAFNLAMAPLHLFAANLNNVLFPSLALLHCDPNQQVDLCCRVSRMLALIVTPLSLAQAVIAPMFIRMLLDPSWYAIVPIVQILSLGMALRCIGWPSASLLQAQGRFVARLVLAVTWAILLLVAVGLGAWLGGVHAAAICVSVVYTIVGPVTLYVALRPSGVTIFDVTRMCIRPLLAGVIVASPSWLVAKSLADSHVALQILATLLLVISLYLPAICLADRAAANELLRRLAPKLMFPLLKRIS